MTQKQTLILLRHAESYNNVPGELYLYDASLTEKGKRQAEIISKQLDIDIDCIISSQFIRTEDTVLNVRKRGQDIPYWVADIGEFNYCGLCDLMRTDRQKMKEQFWNQTSSIYKLKKECESFEEFILRIKKFLEHIISTPYAKILVCSHKYFIAGILWYQRYLNSSDLYDIKKFKYFCNLNRLSCGQFIYFDLERNENEELK